MIRTIKRWLEPPVFQDDEAKTRRAELLNLVILISLAITFLAVLAWLFGKNLSPGTLIIGILWLLVLWASRRLLRSGKSGVVEFILIVIFFVAITGAIISQGSIRSTAISFYVFWVILVVMLYSLPGLLIATCVSSLAVLGLILAENARLLPRADFSVGVRQWLMLTSLFAMTAGLAYFTNKVTRRALASAENEIEQRKQLEDTLRESQESYRILFENATEIILVAQEGKVVFQNPKAATLSGYYGVELMQRSFIEFVHPDDRDMVINRHVKRMKGEDVPPVYSFRLVQKDGGVRWVDASAVMINWKGKPATLNFLADITDRKLYEDELYYSREQYRSLVENINDVIFTLDLQGAFTYMSPAIERLSGFTVSEVEGLSFNRFTHPDDLSGMVEAFTKVISGIKVTYEFRVLDKTGEVRWVVTKSRLVAESDKPPYIAGVMTDITLRKQSEAAKAAFEAKNLQLQKTESLEHRLGHIKPLLLSVCVF